MTTPQTNGRSFPSACISEDSGRTLIEVHLIAHLGPGRGNVIAQQAAHLQRQHPHFVDALEEPSTCIGKLQQSDTDHSSLYTFLVERRGHPFHCHASARVFTAISGGDGTQLRFSTAKIHPSEQNEQNEQRVGVFFEYAHCVNIPADCLFAVRFVAGVWHQFVPGREHSHSPALFAVSCHPDDLVGINDPVLMSDIQAGNASIPKLTEVMPTALAAAISKETKSHTFAAHCKTAHQLEFAYGSAVKNGTVHAILQLATYRLRSMATNLQTKVQQAVRLALQPFQVLHNVLKASLFWDTQKKPVPPHSLVWAQLLDQKSYHLDHFELRVSCEQLQSWRRHDATTYLSELLTAFVEAAPVSVGGLMRLRNAIVGPFGLRTSHLGCPVSSLLSVQAQEYFLDRFPVWTQHVNADNTEAQVVLGANDKHVEFRSVVMVEIDEEGIVISLSNRVAYRNAFGHFYMACIKWIHQTYIVPKMLSSAAHRLCAPEQLAKTQHCRCLRSIFG